MTDIADPWALLEATVDANEYMTIATADASGRPWATPVWFATIDCREFFWVSRPGARHSTNLAARPEVAISVFDSHQKPGTGRGIYLSALATLVPDEDVDEALAVFSAASQRSGLSEWVRSDVQAPARLRLYRAVVAEHFVLSDKDERVPAFPPSDPSAPPRTST